jgi:rhodanese-related sulfurtransferase
VRLFAAQCRADHATGKRMDRLLEYIANHPFLVGAAGLMAVVVLGYELRQRGHSASSLSPGEVVRLMNGGATLVDVRSTNQFKDGHIGGARNVPGDQIADGSAALEKLRDKTLIICCDSGTASGAAARKLTQLGFKQVYNLRGGLAAWRQDNLPVVRG